MPRVMSDENTTSTDAPNPEVNPSATDAPVPEPGQRPEREMSDGEKAWLEEQKRYDMPDERPRELDWTGREERRRGPSATACCTRDSRASDPP